MNITFATNKVWDETPTYKKPDEIDKKLEEGWQRWRPSFPEDCMKEEEYPKLVKWTKELKEKKIEYLFVIGMGGSSLGAKALAGFGFIQKEKLLFWEGTHPYMLKKYATLLENKKTAVLWVSKSGTTLESRVNLSLTREFFPGIPEYFITSSPDKIQDLCHDSERIFSIPKNLGGRFSVVSPVGVMPLLFIDAAMDQFLNGFRTASEMYHISIPCEENRAKKTATEIFSLLKLGYKGVIFWIYSHELLQWGDWLVQLWGESLGKNPSVEALPLGVRGPEDQHSLLQYFQEGANRYIHLFCHTESYAPYDARIISDNQENFADKSMSEILTAQMSGVETAFSENGRPVGEYIFSEIYQNSSNKVEPNLALMGKWMSYWMYVVTYMGYLYEVNPFDQPGVEKAKVYCKEILESKREAGSLQESFVL